MTNSFESMNKQYSLQQLADFTGGEVYGDKSLEISGVSPFETATSKDICLARTEEYIQKIPLSMSKAFIVTKVPDFKDLNFLVHNNPYSAFAKIISLFHPLETKEEMIHPSVSIGRRFSFGKRVYLGPGCVIGDNVVLGDDVYIYPNTTIGDNVLIDNGSRIYSGVTIYSDCEIGKRVIIHSGTVIGSDGFGFAPDSGSWVKINHLGKVIIKDDVEIGASNTIDRGTFGNTVIGKSVKTDNQVHLAHNVEVGDNTILIAQSGVAGSTKIGKNCIIAGKAGISGHLKIEDFVIIGPMTGVTGNIKSGSVVSGIPEMPHKLWLKVSKILTRLPELRRKVSLIEKRVKNIEKK
ncbi:MAG: UDP-3-O-(3-hydroxymyristoyl)glucosamine N-acyltransferase [Desulforegulaceae bacterium]|nr:UDP-3-O-(3-hydroxymyristoyl)glucosamine N-acyltransferase [Desulforegulaceae bacterium]